MGSPNDNLSAEQQLIYDLEYAWHESRWAVFTGSNTNSLMAGVDDPVLLDKSQIEIILNAIDGLSSDAIGKTGKPLIKPLRDSIASFEVSVDQMNYALKQRDPYPDGLKTYAKSVLMESLTHFEMPPELRVQHILRGKGKEPKAVDSLSFEIGQDFVKTGYEQEILLYCDDFGSTPDGLIIDDNGKIITGCEIKCPDKSTHWDYMRNIKDGQTLKEHESKYYWQIQSHILCADADYWWFASFDDRFKSDESHLHYCKIEKCEEDQIKILSRLEMAREYQELIK